jgi:hypothetical protein
VGHAAQPLLRALLHRLDGGGARLGGDGDRVGVHRGRGVRRRVGALAAEAREERRAPARLLVDALADNGEATTIVRLRRLGGG